VGHTVLMRIVGTALVAVTIGVSFLLVQGGWILAGTGQLAGTEKATPRSARKVWLGYSHFRDSRGMTVENVDGERLGTVTDFVMEMQSGQPAYAIVKAGGFGHRRLVIVPMSAIALSTVKSRIAAIDITKAQWKHAPDFSRKDLALMGHPERAYQVARFYGQSQQTSGPIRSVDSQRLPLRSTGRLADSAINPGPQGRYQLANDLIGNQLIARQQVEIGKISDLLVDLGGAKPAFAVVSANRVSGAGENFAVPLRMMRLMPEHTVAVSADRQDFHRAKPFRDGVGQTSGGDENNEIYRYER
jgi:ribosomal 30S subunit maturation factor RimM